MWNLDRKFCLGCILNSSQIVFFLCSCDWNIYNICYATALSKQNDRKRTVVGSYSDEMFTGMDSWESRKIHDEPAFNGEEPAHHQMKLKAQWSVRQETDLFFLFNVSVFCYLLELENKVCVCKHTHIYIHTYCISNCWYTYWQDFVFLNAVV